MAGLIKAKKYDWKDSNLALFGSETEREVKKSAAEQEPAWEGAGTQVGLQIWRIVNFKVTDWPKDDYGKFYGGDSYIILNTYNADPSSEALSYDLHFWIGGSSTQDEYGTAAYKTVELDTYLDDKPVQHREVQGHESELFKSYFTQGIMILEGGAESGFRHVTPVEYKPRLLHVTGLKKNIVVTEIPLSRSLVHSDDVFILDLGLKLYQWNGKESNKDEKFKGMQILNNLRSERPKAEYETLDEFDTPEDHEFYTLLTGTEEVEQVSAFHIDHPFEELPNQLYKISDAETGKVEISLVKEGEVAMEDFDSNDVFLLDTGNQCFVWVGSGASRAERSNAFIYAHTHLMKTDHPLVSVVVVKEKQPSVEFTAALAA